MVPSEKSRAGRGYLGAGGEEIPNLGQTDVTLEVKDGPTGQFRFQGPPVRKPLLSVSACNDKGNLVVFDGNASVIIPRAAPELADLRRLVHKVQNKIPLKRRNGVFTMMVRQPVGPHANPTRLRPGVPPGAGGGPATRPTQAKAGEGNNGSRPPAQGFGGQGRR